MSYTRRTATDEKECVKYVSVCRTDLSYSDADKRQEKANVTQRSRD
jgi:hypothetical protein